MLCDSLELRIRHNHKEVTIVCPAVHNVEQMLGRGWTTKTLEEGSSNQSLMSNRPHKYLGMMVPDMISKSANNICKISDDEICSRN